MKPEKKAQTTHLKRDSEHNGGTVSLLSMSTATS